MSKNAVALKSELSDVVAKKVRQFQQSGELHLPANYSPENAMKSAWLILQATQDKDKNPVLTSCTKESIMNSMLDMVVQGLNPVKKQCYFIAYGKNLVCQRSYFGTMAVAMQVDESISDIIAEVVYEGDTFKYGLRRGKKEITEHTQQLENVNRNKIRAAYALVINTDGEVVKTEIMTFDEIKQAWKQSQMNPFDDKGEVKANSTHGKFTADMCKKTVINKVCKPIINASSDSHLLRQSIVRSGEIQAEIEVAEEIELNANTTPIDIVEAEYEDLPADGPAEEAQQQSIGPDF